MADRYFVDTNVLVYARDASEPEKQPVARAWMQWLWKRQAGRLSTQVLQEFYQTVTRKLQPGLDPTVARSECKFLLTEDLQTSQIVDGVKIINPFHAPPPD